MNWLLHKSDDQNIDNQGKRKHEDNQQQSQWPSRNRTSNNNANDNNENLHGAASVEERRASREDRAGREAH